MRSVFFTFMTIVFSVTLSYSQEVSTYASIPVGFGDGMTVDADGELYISSGFQSTKIIKVALDGTVSDFFSGLNGPVGLDFDSAGNLFVVNYNNGIITRINPAGEASQFAAGLDGPAGLYVDKQNNVYVSLFGANFSGTGQAILKFLPDGTRSTFVSGSGIGDAIGIYADGNDVFYTTNWTGGNVFKIESSTVSVVGTITGANINQIAYANGVVFIPCPNLNKVYTYDTAGNMLKHFAGSGQNGDLDGALLEAQFKNPNSAAVSPAGDRLYILDPGAGKIKLIDLSPTTGINSPKSMPVKFDLGSNYPNPFNPETTISYSVPREGRVELKVFNSLGKEIATLVAGHKNIGTYQNKFSGIGLPSGIYYYRLTSGSFTSVKTMMLVK